MAENETQATETARVGDPDGAPARGSSATPGPLPVAEGAMYVVQICEEFEEDAGKVWSGWRDLDEPITVPKRTKRDTVIRQAARRLSLPVGEESRIRVIPWEFAEEIPVGLKAREPELVIGGGA